MSKQVYMIGGANGSGKTTAAMTLLPDFLSVEEFVNADNIAVGLSPLNPESMAIAAGKLMIERMRNLIAEGRSFAYETTCAGKTHVRTLRKCKEAGYNTTLIFLWLPTEEMAVRRVANRVAEGGHNIPEDTIRRRYKLGMRNLVELFVPICDNVTVYDNTQFLDVPRDVIAQKFAGNEIEVVNNDKWQHILEVCNEYPN